MPGQPCLHLVPTPCQGKLRDSLTKTPSSVGGEKSQCKTGVLLAEEGGLHHQAMHFQMLSEGALVGCP